MNTALSRIMSERSQKPYVRSEVEARRVGSGASDCCQVDPCDPVCISFDQKGEMSSIQHISRHRNRVRISAKPPAAPFRCHWHMSPYDTLGTGRPKPEYRRSCGQQFHGEAVLILGAKRGNV